MKKKILVFSILVMIFSVFVAVPLTQAQSEKTTSDNGIVKIIKKNINDKEQKIADTAVSKVKKAFTKTIGSISDFFTNRIGINLVEGVKLLGRFFIWAFESLAKLVRWLLSLF